MTLEAKSTNEIEVPSFLDLPDKLMCLLDPEVFNKYTIFIIEGGRGSAKTQSVARFLSYLCEKNKVRIVGAREQQNSIEDSVYTVFDNVIRENELNFDVNQKRMIHNETGSKITFRGMRDRGAVNIKGMEDVDIVWFEESQSASKTTLDILIPTLRKNNCKFIFTLNRYVRNDPIMDYASDEETLHIHIDYFENHHCPDILIKRAETCKAKNMKEYNHIWLGQPLATTTEYLFNFDKLAKCKDIEPFGEPLIKHKILGVDFASGGGDLCAASLIERTSNTHWQLKDQIVWDNPDTDESVGKVISLYGDWRPDIFICDADGLGYPMFVTISKAIPNIIGFKGGSNDKCKTPCAHNNRFQAYSDLKYWVDQEWIQIKCQYTIKELETIQKKYMTSGKMLLRSKQDQKSDGVASQDRADSLAMAVHAAIHYLGKVDFNTVDRPIGMRTLKRITGRKKR